MEETKDIWYYKLFAWLHDPAEKALILMRGRESHEEGTVAEMRRLCFGDVPEPWAEQVARQADHWAAAADRPQHPRPEDLRMQAAEAPFWKEPELVHPLAGDRLFFHELYVDSRKAIEAASFAKLKGLVTKEGENQTLSTVGDRKQAFLRLWRRAPETPPETLGLVWQLLPADSRVPDHSIWDHLSLTSAFAGILGQKKTPALLMVSLGPVQGFIEKGKTTTDLWAGSHMLSVLAWEAMRPIVASFGPDAVILPSLRGLPLLDLWLEEQGVALDKALAQSLHRETEENPLFRASIPNRFIAIVPLEDWDELTNKIKESLQSTKAQLITKAVELLAELVPQINKQAAIEVMGTQLEGFPEVHVACVPMALVEEKGGNLVSVKPLRELLNQTGGTEGSFLEHPLWKLLDPENAPEGKEITLTLGGDRSYMVFRPNRGVLYPAYFELVSRGLAFAKAARTFAPLWQEGYRCTMCGEREWIGGESIAQQEGRTVRARDLPPGSRRGEVIWSVVASKRRSWVREGEALCGPCTIKRLWPELFFRLWVNRSAEGRPEEAGKLQRFVVSTHTMALAPDLYALAKDLSGEAGTARGQEARKRLEKFEAFVRNNGFQLDMWTPLPKKLHRATGDNKTLEAVVRSIPALWDELREAKDSARQAAFEAALAELFGHRPENYYGLILMDGDRMGQWLSGDPQLLPSFRDVWHSGVVESVRSASPELLRTPRASSPSLHRFVSSALAAFSRDFAPYVVEELFCGRLIYAGGDDLLAMVAVDDLLPCMFLLRCAYSGIFLGNKQLVWSVYDEIRNWVESTTSGKVSQPLGKGYGIIRNRLYPLMGGVATASMGAVVAHHLTPLGLVLKNLREAERDAKEYGRNAFSIRILKRAGGRVAYTASWGFGGKASQNGGKSAHRDLAYDPPSFASRVVSQPIPMEALFQLRETLACPGVSRRAVYNALAWLRDLPPRPGVSLGEQADSQDSFKSMLVEALAYQFRRQGITSENLRKAFVGASYQNDPAQELAEKLVEVAFAQCSAASGNGASIPDHLAHLLLVAEFLAREGRAPRVGKPAGGEP